MNMLPLPISMMFKKLTVVILLLVSGLACCNAQVNATITCLTCTTYNVNLGSSNITMSCPSGTVCGVPVTSNSTSTNTTAASTTSICSASNSCNGVVCDHYARFASPTNCKQYYLCRYRPALSAYVLSTLTCPGASIFSSNIGKCVLSSSATCSTTATTG